MSALGNHLATVEVLFNGYQFYQVLIMNEIDWKI